MSHKRIKRTARAEEKIVRACIAFPIPLDNRLKAEAKKDSGRSKSAFVNMLVKEAMVARGLPVG